MVAGFERYFQIVRCFRDEDLRKDRQPEFTQIDIETSFLDRDDFLPIIEGLVAEIWRRVKGVELALPFPRLAYDEAMARYGSDKPDLRFGLELQDCSALFAGGEFQAFAQAVAGGGAVKALRVPGAGGMSRKELDDLTAEAKQAGAKGLVWIKVTADGLQSPGGQVHPGRPGSGSSRRSAVPRATSLLLVADTPAVAATVLGRLRVDLAAPVQADPGGSRRLRLGHRLPARGVERRREALGRGPPSVHGAPRRGPARCSNPTRAAPAPRPTISC